MSGARALVWLRGKDLRLADHAPLQSALRDTEVFPLFVLDPAFFSPERAARAPRRIQYLLAALDELASALRDRGSRLVVVQGRSVEVVPRVVRQLGIDRVVAHRWVEPFARERDARVKAALGDRFELFEGETLLTPGTIRNKSDEPYSVFTPFAKACRAVLSVSAPIEAPARLPPVRLPRGFATASIPTMAELGLPVVPGLIEPGETAARARADRFFGEGIASYAVERDRMDHDGTSRLSADLHFGTISVREVFHRAARTLERARSLGRRSSIDKFMNELLWREFTHHTLWDRPHLLERPFRPAFEGFPWRDDDAGFEAWWRGRTGYPIVDAAARQLLEEGWVHNRARMISASFLTKHLMIDYRLGEAHFLRMLVDGDWAQNNAGWQWAAGTGCDAQPWFRIFNPVAQGKRFDPEGAYVRRFVPELARLPDEWIHAPWEAPADVLAKAGIVLKTTYPAPIVDHRAARARYLATARAHLRG